MYFFPHFSPHYFKYIKVSALALLKMVMHARSGGNLEVMGLLLGKVDGNTMIVMDCFALPVEGTETRVNAQAQAYEYMAAYTEAAKQVSRKVTSLRINFHQFDPHNIITFYDLKRKGSLKKLCEKEKMLKTSIFFPCLDNVLYPP